jgi:endonuclease/exonuclease/phosphatase family metal-dependent hydrolase
MIKLISSNLRFKNDFDGIHHWDKRKYLLRDKISDYDPCFVGTQEGREPQLRELEQLINFNLSDLNRQWLKERMYPCLYWKKLRPIISGDFWLSNTPDKPGSKSFDSMFPRLCTWIKVFKNDFFYVFNVHLDHIKSYTREEQARVIRDQIRRINWDNRPIILMGDFNSAPNSRVYNFLKSTLNLVDPWVELNQAEEGSFHMFKGDEHNGARIDWILHTKHFRPHAVKLLKYQFNGIYLSDHYPVYCELTLK